LEKNWLFGIAMDPSFALLLEHVFDNDDEEAGAREEMPRKRALTASAWLKRIEGETTTKPPPSPRAAPPPRPPGIFALPAPAWMAEPGLHPDFAAIMATFRAWGRKLDYTPTAEMLDQFEYYHGRKAKTRLVVGPLESEHLTYAFHWVRTGVLAIKDGDQEGAEALHRAQRMHRIGRLPVYAQVSHTKQREKPRVRAKQWRPPPTPYQLSLRAKANVRKIQAELDNETKKRMAIYEQFAADARAIEARCAVEWDRKLERRATAERIAEWRAKMPANRRQSGFD
jgi:hypothetical protein